MKGLKDKYFINRLGYNNEKPIEECNTIPDCMGYVEVNITKKNEKSFRCDYSESLYKEIPKDWHEYDEDRLYWFSISSIVSILVNDGGYYMNRVRKAISFMREEDKTILANRINETIKKKAKQFIKDTTTRYNNKIADNPIGYREVDDWIGNHTGRD